MTTSAIERALREQPMNTDNNKNLSASNGQTLHCSIAFLSPGTQILYPSEYRSTHEMIRDVECVSTRSLGVEVNSPNPWYRYGLLFKRCRWTGRPSTKSARGCDTAAGSAMSKDDKP